MFPIKAHLETADGTPRQTFDVIVRDRSSLAEIDAAIEAKALGIIKQDGSTYSAMSLASLYRTTSAAANVVRSLLGASPKRRP